MNPRTKTSMSCLLLFAGMAFGLAPQARAVEAAPPAGPAGKLPGPTTKPTPAKADRDGDAILAAAKASPLFRRELEARSLKKLGLSRISLAPGVEMDLARYLRETRLDRNPELTPLFDATLTKSLLASAPTYRESIVELEDRLVIDRELTLRPNPRACAKASPSKAFAELCFTKKAGAKLSPEVRKELEQMRAELAKVSGSTLALGSMTADDLLRVSDEALLELVLNGSERTIRHVSIVARAPVDTTTAKATLYDFSKRLPVAKRSVGLAKKPVVVPIPAGPTSSTEAPAQEFDTEYFLTGFTWGRSVDDSWEYTIAKKNWWHGRYYVRVSWHLGFGFGVRAPFSVSVASRGSADRRTVELSVAPVDVDSNGGPAYPAVGLPASQTFGGREFVLDASASCRIYASIPGPNVDASCGSIGIDESRDADPVIGQDTTTIPTWWLPGEVTGLGGTAGPVGAWVDLGVSATISNGRIGLRAMPFGDSAFAGLEPGHLSFDATDPIAFEVTRSGGSASAGLRLDEPRYDFDLSLSPSVRGRITVDVGPYEKDWTVAQATIGALKITQSFGLTRHEGTVGSHDYVLFTEAPSSIQPAKAPAKAQPKAPHASKPLPPSSVPKLPGSKPAPKLPGAK